MVRNEGDGARRRSADRDLEALEIAGVGLFELDATSGALERYESSSALLGFPADEFPRTLQGFLERIAPSL